MSTLAFNPSGNLIAAGTINGENLLMDFSTLQILVTLTGHRDVVEHLVFSTDGQYLISASLDGTIRT